ncbi:MAG: flagellar basal-body rod protein FlgF, partial [Parvularculaceae bacterium]|nr:flagellar basal-body rod protein FlgF [Parvularculaceae bacterium]
WWTMENAIIAGLSKQIVLSRALETSANNIANQTTAGFKADHLAFREYIAKLQSAEDTDPLVSLVSDPDTYTDFSAGSLQQTYRDLDFAIDGDGFFAVETASGVQYTRDGRFAINNYGELVTAAGARVLDTGGSPILIDPEEGAVLLTPEGELQQDQTPIAKLGVYEFTDAAELRKTGENMFAAQEQPMAATFFRARQGFIENSNVNPVAAMTDMIEIMRSYEQTARMIEISNELARDAVNRLSQNA